MSAEVPHIAVDRIIPVFLGRDLELVLARVNPVPPPHLLRIRDSDSEGGPRETSEPMSIVGRLRVGPDDALGAALVILDLLNTAGELDVEGLSAFVSGLADEANKRAEEAKADAAHAEDEPSQ